MKNLFKKFMKEERGDVVQYVIVLAVIAIVLAYAFPKIKERMTGATDQTMNSIDDAFTPIPGQ